MKNSKFHRKIRRKNLVPQALAYFFFPSPLPPPLPCFIFLFLSLLPFLPAALPCVHCWRPSICFPRALTEVQGWHSNICRPLVPNLLISMHLMSRFALQSSNTKVWSVQSCPESGLSVQSCPESAFGYICTFKLVSTPGGPSIVEREGLSLLSHGSWANLAGRVDSWEQLTLVQTIYLGPWDSDTSLVWGCKALQLTIPSSRSPLYRWGGWPLN